ncbi:hypothetical protein CEJ86_30130 [Sinorhizobium meliloti]|uniref:Uncharacterized protein n=2 Tax=Rhizobium meliloti TaxID=382 RepID=A0A2J0YU14_RHIML|nr:hypothetical protein CEJ86_30130 [Sinorhizobium meliloti]
MVAVACGVLALVVSVATVVDGTGAVFQGKDFAYYVVGPGWGGMVLSIALIAVSAWALKERSRLSSAYVALAALAGTLVGGTLLISGLLALALVGGLLGMFSAEPAATPTGNRPGG